MKRGIALCVLAVVALPFYLGWIDTVHPAQETGFWSGVEAGAVMVAGFGLIGLAVLGFILIGRDLDQRSK